MIPSYIIVIQYCVYCDYYQGGSSPVMLAAINGHKDTILMLIKKGANLNLVNKVSMNLFVKVKFITTSFLKYINIT